MTPPSLRIDRRAGRIAMAVGAGALALLLGALGFQYIGGIAPCEMCHWQRWPYIAAAILGIVGGAVVRDRGTARSLTVLVIVLVLSSGLIGAYQTGMQWHLLPGPAACTGHRFILGSDMAPPVVQCDQVTWQLFGISMPSYNAIFSFLITALAGLALWRKAK